MELSGWIVAKAIIAYGVEYKKAKRVCVCVCVYTHACVCTQHMQTHALERKQEWEKET